MTSQTSSSGGGDVRSADDPHPLPAVSQQPPQIPSTNATSSQPSTYAVAARTAIPVTSNDQRARNRALAAHRHAGNETSRVASRSSGTAPRHGVTSSSHGQPKDEPTLRRSSRFQGTRDAAHPYAQGSTSQSSLESKNHHVNIPDDNPDTASRLKAEITSLRSRLRESEEKYARAQAHWTNDTCLLRGRIHEQENKIRSLERRLGGREEENASLRSRLGESEETTQALVTQADEERKRLNYVIDGKDSIIASMKNREAELQDAHTFLTSEDRCSAADIVALVNALNYEIMQVSTITAEHMTTSKWKSKSMTGLENVQTEAYRRVQSILGSRFCRELAAADQDTAITLLQFAFQGVICSCSRYYIEQWNGDSRSLSRGLGSIYEAMRQREPQAVFGRWRALTQQQINEVMNEKLSDSLTLNLIDDMIDVAVVCRVQEPGLSDLLDPFLADKLDTIVSLLLRIKNAITIDFVSGDIHPVIATRRQQFAGHDMRSVHDLDGESGGNSVLFTTELGLSVIKKQKGAGGVHDECSVLKTPEVFVESSLLEIIR